MVESTIEVVNIYKHFDKVSALNGINLQLQNGGQYVIQGASGSGKSTLLYLLGGLDRASKGEVVVAGRRLSVMNDEELAQYRNKYVGFVFQFHFLLGTLNCFDNILLPAQIGGVKQSLEIKNFVKDLSKYLGVDHCLKKYPYQLSGGEQQRINLIRALSLRPKLLLCDEPTGNLDSINSKKVTELLIDLAKKFNSTLVVVTHDSGVASYFPHGFLLKDGVVEKAF